MISQIITVPVGTKGVDYSGARPDVSWAGYAVRYVAGGPMRAKLLTKVEVGVLHALLVPVLVVYEWASGNPNYGAPLGLIDGTIAKSKCLELGYPITLPILVAVDLDSVPANIGQHEAYVREFAAACAPYPIGIYGDTDIMRRCLDISVLNWRAASSWWSRFLPKPDWLHVLQQSQSADHTYDNNISLRPFEAWLPHQVPDPIPTTPTVHVFGDDDMPAIVKNADNPGDKFALQDDGELVPMSEEDFKARGIALTLEVGYTMASAEIARRLRKPASVAPTPVIDYLALAAALASEIPRRFNGSIEITAAG